MKRKPRPGVCGLCGIAVVQPKKKRDGWCLPPDAPPGDIEIPSTYLWGHHYFDGELTSVRCESCVTNHVRRH